MEYPVIELSLGDKKFPKLLKHIHQPPKRLFCRGDLSLLDTPCFAVVGTRKMTSYGQEAIGKIIPDLAKYFTIVSGMALGIDAAAQDATITARGKTIAVLATAVTQPTPRANVALANEILRSGGLLISEHNGKDPVYARQFAIRDRIISGLSKGVLIIEADIKSGSLITAKCAMDQGRDVFAVPGSIFSSGSAGTHLLIKNGAKPVASAEDILEEYDKLPLPKVKRVSTTNPTEARILAILASSGTASVDTLIEKIGIEISEVLATLSVMELAGLVVQAEDGTYRSNS